MLLVTLAARKASSGRSARLFPRARYPAEPPQLRPTRDASIRASAPGAPAATCASTAACRRAETADSLNERLARIARPTTTSPVAGPGAMLPGGAHGHHRQADPATNRLHPCAGPHGVVTGLTVHVPRTPVWAAFNAHRRVFDRPWVFLHLPDVELAARACGSIPADGPRHFRSSHALTGRAGRCCRLYPSPVGLARSDHGSGCYRLCRTALSDSGRVVTPSGPRTGEVSLNPFTMQ